MELLTHRYKISDAGTQGAMGDHCPPPQYLADQLTLLQAGDYPHLLLLAPQIFSPSGITHVWKKYLDHLQSPPTIYVILILGKNASI
jgi:hypothetical protein